MLPVLLRDSVLYLAAKALPAAVAAVAVVVFIRVVGVAAYGAYATVLSVALVASALGAGWLSQAQLRYGSQYASDPRVLVVAVRRGVRRATAVVLLVTAAAAAWAAATPGALPATLVALGGLLACGAMRYTTRLATVQAQLQPGRVVRAEVVRAVLALAVPLVFVALWRADAAALLAGVASAYAAASFVARPAGQARTGVPAPDVPAVRTVRRVLWRYGWPLSLWLACSLGFQMSDRLLLQLYLGAEATGTYAAVYDLVVRAFALVFMPVTLAAHPRIMEAWNAGRRAEGRRVLRYATLAQFVLFAPLLLTLTLAGEPLLRAVLDVRVDVLRPALVVPLAVGGFVWQTALLLHKPLEMAGRTRTMLALVAAAWAADVLFLVWALPRWGVLAPGVAFAGAGALYVAGCLLAARRTARDARTEGTP